MIGVRIATFLGTFLSAFLGLCAGVDSQQPANQKKESSKPSPDSPRLLGELFKSPNPDSKLDDLLKPAAPAPDKSAPPPILPRFPDDPGGTLEQATRLIPVPTVPTLPMTESEAKDYAMVVGRCEKGTPSDAQLALISYLKSYPSGEKSAEMLFRLATFEAVEPKSQPEAVAHFKQLIRDFPDSSWARFAAAHAMKENEVYDAALEFRKDALAAKDRRLAAAAKNALLESGRRAEISRSMARLYETGYLLIDVCRLLGDEQSADQAMSALREALSRNQSDAWLKLAAIRSSMHNDIGKALDSLIAIDNGCRVEAARLIVDLVRAHGDAFIGDDALRYRFHRALALTEIGSTEMGIMELSALSRDHPQSSWAGESLFWLANMAHDDDRVGDAQLLLHELVVRQPDHPRADVAKRWADEIDRRDETAAALEQILLATLKQWKDNRFRVWLKARTTTETGKKISAELAFLSPHQFRAEMLCNGLGVIFVSNQKGTWLWDGIGGIRHSKKPIDVGVPKFKAKLDPIGRHFDFHYGFDGNPENAVDLDLPEDWARYVAEKLTRYQVTIERKLGDTGGRRCIRFEWANRTGLGLSTVTLIVSKAGCIEAASLRWYTDEGQQCDIVVDRFTLGGDIPEDRFVPCRTDHVPVIEVDEINLVTFLGQAMLSWSDVASSVPGPMRK
jgi:tetratricopeptide (TPR) repeat protein